MPNLLACCEFAAVILDRAEIASLGFNLGENVRQKKLNRLGVSLRGARFFAGYGTTTIRPFARNSTSLISPARPGPNNNSNTNDKMKKGIEKVWGWGFRVRV